MLHRPQGKCESQLGLADQGHHHPDPGCCCRWQAYHKNLCALHIGQQQLCSLLGASFLAHDYVLTPTQLKRALTYLGPNQRLRRVVRDMITGRGTVNVGVIGTSVSWGTGGGQVGNRWGGVVECI